MLYSIFKVILGAFLKIKYRIKVVNHENIPVDGGVIICANHQSNYDPFVIGLSLKRQMHFMAKIELFKPGIANYLMTNLNAYPVNREKTDMNAYKQTLAILKKGGVIGIFAQGRRSETIDSKEAKSGVALFAMKGQVPVIPVGVSGNYNKLFSTITVNIGKPISMEEYKGQKVKTELLEEITEKIMVEVEKLVENDEC